MEFVVVGAAGGRDVFCTWYFVGFRRSTLTTAGPKNVFLTINILYERCSLEDNLTKQVRRDEGLMDDIHGSRCLLQLFSYSSWLGLELLFWFETARILAHSGQCGPLG